MFINLYNTFECKDKNGFEFIHMERAIQFFFILGIDLIIKKKKNVFETEIYI